MWHGFKPIKLIVLSALKTLPATSPLSHINPVGISSAILYALDSLARLTASKISSVMAPLVPVPKIASTITSLFIFLFARIGHTKYRPLL